MRVAFIGIKGFPSKGGTERVVEAIVKRLAGRHEITVYCDSRYTPASVQMAGVRLIRVPTIPGKHTGAASLFLLCALHALLFGHYNLIHLHGVEASFTLPLLRLRYRVIATSHGSPTRNRKEKWGRVAQFLMEQMEYPFVHFSNLPVSVSLADAEYYEKRYLRKVIYIPNGVDEDIRGDKAAARRALEQAGLQPGSYLLFCAGRIDPSKGCHLAVEAYQRANPAVPLVVIGDLNQLPAYSAALSEQAKGRAIYFLPPIAEKALLFGIVQQCRLFLFPSLKEGMSVMLLEAASLGVPLVCSDIAENRASVGDGVLYFRSGDAADLAEKLTWALDHPAEMAALGQKARQTVLTTLPWGKIADAYYRLYQACCQSGSALPDASFAWPSSSSEESGGVSMAQPHSSGLQPCQIASVPRIGQAIPDRELGPLSLKQRARLLLKRLLPAETKRKFKRQADALRVTLAPARPDPAEVIPVPEKLSAGFQPGERVLIRSKEEIAATLNSWGELKGCGFMGGMEQYCGTVQRVWKPVQRFVDERDYRVKKTRGVYILEGLVCQGSELYGRCDRSCFFFWREEWLRKVADAGGGNGGSARY